MFGEKIKLLREQAGLSRKAVANDLGIHETTYGKYELEKREPDLETIHRLANYFKVSVNALIENDNPPPTQKEPATDNGDGLTDEERGYIKMYRSASPELQAAALGMLEAAEKARLARDSSAKDR